MKVLLDLSLCIYPHNGMNQDMRMLLRGLAEDPGVEVTGLVYSRRRGALHESLCRTGNAERQMLHQSRLLRAMVTEDPSVFGKPGPGRWLRECRRGWLQRRFHVQPLRHGPFFDLIWRHYLQFSFERADMEVLRHVRYAVSDLVSDIYIDRAHAGRAEPYLDTRGYDVAVFPDATPLRVARGTRKIVRCHDLIPLNLPDTLQNHAHMNFQHRSIRFCREDSFFVCDSEATRRDLCAAFAGMEQRSRTVHCAVAGHYHPDSRPEQVQEVFRRRAVCGTVPGGVRPYFLAVSTLEPRKNYLRLLEAFEAAVEGWEPQPLMVLVGAEGWNNAALLERVQALAHKGRLLWLRGVTPHEMRLVYSSAVALANVSFAEGFGYSGVEAMKCGTPVVASGIDVHREVCGEAAVYCDPYSTESICDALVRAGQEWHTERERRQARVEQGLKQVSAYEARALLPQWKECFAPGGIRE